MLVAIVWTDPLWEYVTSERHDKIVEIPKQSTCRLRARLCSEAGAGACADDDRRNEAGGRRPRRRGGGLVASETGGNG